MHDSTNLNRLPWFRHLSMPCPIPETPHDVDEALKALASIQGMYLGGCRVMLSVLGRTNTDVDANRDTVLAGRGKTDRSDKQSDEQTPTRR